jgi:hypothetical protein
MDTSVYLTMTVATLVVCAFVILTRRRQGPMKASYPPGPKPLPFLGNILDIVAPEPWLLYMRWEEDYQSELPGRVFLPLAYFAVM